MIPSARLAQLYAVRAQIEALIVAEEAEYGQSQRDPKACPHCNAPEDKQVEAQQMGGGKTIACLVCKQQRAA